MVRTSFQVCACLVVAAVLAACSSKTTPSSSGGATLSAVSHGKKQPSPAEKVVKPQDPVPVESNPPGDIPDDTAFVPYHSDSGHFTISVPEGWSRRTTKSSFTFSDKLNSISAQWSKVAQEPTLKSVQSREIAELKRTERAVRLGKTIMCSPTCTIPYSTAPITVTLPAARALVITYRSNSPPNKVTGKEYRDENLRFLFFKNGREIALTLSGPVGSDNVDPWTLVSQSFKWD